MKRPNNTRLALVLAAMLIAAGTARAQYAAAKVFTFLQDTYNRHDKNLNDFLIGELSHYAEIFPEEENAAEAQYLLAMVYEVKGDEHEALVSFFKTMFLYPNGAKHAACAEALRKIIASEKAYASKKDKLLAIVNGQFEEKTAADRFYDYLGFLMELDQSNLHQWAIDETRRFVARFPSDERIDRVLRWTADLLEKKGNHREAAVGYLKLEYVFPESDLLTYARYNRGVLLYEELGEHQKAVDAFNQVVTDGADSAYAGAALFMLGEIKQKKLKDYKGAITDYRKLIENYPSNAKTVDAFFAIAEIQADKLSAYAEAIATYDELVDKYKTDERGIKALEKAGDLYRTKLDDFTQAAAYYAKVAEIYPYYEKAPEMLLRAGSLCEDKLKDYKKAIEYYQLVVEKFPENRLAAEAKRRMGKLQAKAGQ